MTPRKKATIYGPDGQPLVRVNDRLAPKPRKHASLEGWVSWGLVDRKGREVQGGEQHNLILNTLLDRIAAAEIGNNFFSHFAVGTGSTTPDVADTALDNELARTTTLVDSSATRPSPGVHVRMIEREFDLAQGNGNLTEFGFSYGASSDMIVRELFRDGSGNPITITKTSDYKLRIKYTFTLTLTPVTLVTAAAFTITGIGVINGAHTWIGSTISNFTDIGVFSAVSRGLDGGPFAGSDAWCSLSTATALAYTTNLNRNPSSTPAGGTNTASAYTPGSHERSISVAIPTTGDNLYAASIVVGTGHTQTDANRRVGWGLLIDVGDRFTKDNLHTLSIDDVLTVSWGRA